MAVEGYKFSIPKSSPYVLGLDHIGYHGNMGFQFFNEEIQNQTITHTKVIGIAPGCQNCQNLTFKVNFDCQNPSEYH